jgi:ankyrin repeat protein
MDIVQYLIERGANINAKDRWGATPLNDTMKEEIKEYLIKHGAQKGKEMPQNSLPICSISDE